METLQAMLVALFLVCMIIDLAIKGTTTTLEGNDKVVLKVKCQWTTSYYVSHGRYHIHIVPENDGDHWEAEDGDCQCHTRCIARDSDGAVYQHKVMTRE